jgi:hypothetical protein
MDHNSALLISAISSQPEWPTVVNLLRELVSDNGEKLLRREPSIDESPILHAKHAGMSELLKSFEWAIDRAKAVAQADPFLVTP